jgi:hypothetical protein
MDVDRQGSLHAARRARAGTPRGSGYPSPRDRSAASGDAYDLIFDSDGAGEIADVVSLRVTDGLVQVTLHHLQILERYDARRPRQGSS